MSKPLAAQLASNSVANHLRGWITLLLWMYLWSLIFNLPMWDNNALILLPGFGFAFFTYGCIWEMNHVSMHLSGPRELPRLFLVAKKQHLDHHKFPNAMEHILVPPWGWVALNKGAIAMGVLSALLAWLSLRGWELPLVGVDLAVMVWLTGYASTWAFMLMYQFCHDTAHSNPGWFVGWRRLLWPASHMQHHVEIGTRYGIFPIFQILERCFPVFREVMWVGRWIEEQRK